MYGKDFGIPNIKQYLTVCSIKKKNLRGFGIVESFPYICLVDETKGRLLKVQKFKFNPLTNYHK